MEQPPAYKNRVRIVRGSALAHIRQLRDERLARRQQTSPPEVGPVPADLMPAPQPLALSRETTLLMSTNPRRPALENNAPAATTISPGASPAVPTSGDLAADLQSPDQSKAAAMPVPPFRSGLVPAPHDKPTDPASVDRSEPAQWGIPAGRGVPDAPQHASTSATPPPFDRDPADEPVIAAAVAAPQSVQRGAAADHPVGAADDRGQSTATPPAISASAAPEPASFVQSPTVPLPLKVLMPDAVSTGVGPSAPQIPDAAARPGPVGAAGPVESSDLFMLPGAGIGLVWLLGQCGVHSLADLASVDLDRLERDLGLVGTLLDLREWADVARARSRLGEATSALH